ncbi:TetR/AcrR family transcriptional regulator [Sediminispirochaeta bajacaliforniensis]|uniref:TetR/AcrR family transcriptional regulator n=1 Tax=Sediminispirochaeta bajacaliforniensis TaxID=148 RepID=UPI00036432D7|nr:TetR/AcrR family transcriptional regulator [Sediminispirochaeta bajacaliforniensis]
MVERLLEVNRRLIISGIGLNDERRVPDFKVIEEQCTLSERDFPETDRVICAVSEVVAENGLWNTTVEKIAHRLGMSKSSLYFYFENRDEMLWRLIDRERQAFGALVIREIEPIGPFADQLYAYFVLYARYLWGRPEFLATMNWYRFQDISFHPPEDPLSGVLRYYRFIEEAVEAGVVSEKVPLVSFFRLLNFLLMQELSDHFRSGDDIKQLFPVLRTLHQLLLYGVQGA